MPNEITTASTLSTKASKTLDTMRARAVKADEARGPGRPGRDRGRDRQPRRGRGVGCAGGPCRHTGRPVPPRGRAGRPHPAPVGALAYAPHAGPAVRAPAIF